MNKLDELEEKIRDARGEDEEAKAEQRRRDADNMSMGMRAGAELTGAIAAGGFIGWLLDRWLDTSPLFLIGMLILGVCTGFFNVYRVTQNIGTGVGFSELHKRAKTAKTAPDDEESD